MKLKPVVQSLLRQNFSVTYSYHRLNLWQRGLRSKNKIVIYQMGKVGSTTIWKSLEALNLNAPVYHVHTLNPDKIHHAIQRDQINFAKRRFIYPETVQSHYLHGQLARHPNQHPWHVITLVRDPVAKILSSFFQKLEAELSLGLDYRKQMKTAGNHQVVQDVIERFYGEYVDNPAWRHPYEWFNAEFNTSLNIDIFTQPSLAGRDYSIFTTPQAKVLLFKLESLTDCYRPAFQAFLGLPEFELIQANLGMQKRYKTLYKEFLQKVHLPVDYIDRVYNSELVKHFYSEAEIEQFYQRWVS